MCGASLFCFDPRVVMRWLEAREPQGSRALQQRLETMPEVPMGRTAFLRAVLPALAAIALLGLTSCQAGLGRDPVPNIESSSGKGASAAQHIIFMSQENRSFDHYFAKLNDYRAAQGLSRDADDLPASASNPDPNGVPVSAFHL